MFLIFRCTRETWTLLKLSRCWPGARRPSLVPALLPSPLPVVQILGVVHPVEEDVAAAFSSSSSSSNDYNHDKEEGEEDEEGDEEAGAGAGRGGGGVVNFGQKFRVHRLFPLVARTIMHADRLGSKLRDTIRAVPSWCY